MLAAVAEVLTRRHPIHPATLNAEARTVEVVLSTFADVRRSYGVERLAADPAAWEIPADGIPLLDGHRTGSFRDILGRVRDIAFRNGPMVGVAHISDADAWAAVERGDLRAISIGYAPRSHIDSRDATTGLKVRTLTKMALLEASLLPIGADPGATVRKHGMEPEVTIEPEAEVTSGDITTRAEINAHIRSFAPRGLSQSFVDGLIDAEPTLADANRRILAELTSARPIIIGRSSEDPNVTRGLQAEAMAASFTGAEPSEGARQYMELGGSLLRHAAVSLTRSGVAGVATMGTDALVTRAMGTTSDFPLILDDAGRRVLLAGYTGAASALKRVARQMNLPDFREATALRAGGLPNLKRVTEAGEIKHSMILESGERFKLDTFATIMGISRQAIINDNFGVFGQWATNAGVAAANTEADLLAELLASNPVMSDGKALFHNDHANLGVGAVPDVDELSDARLAMRLQTGLDGKSIINATPKFLVVAADLETRGEQLLAELAATTVDNANPFPGKLTLLVEPRLPTGEWYLFADPATVPVLAYGYLSSAPGPQLASRDGWEVLGREWRVVLDFGAGALDHRGAFKNPGGEI